MIRLAPAEGAVLESIFDETFPLWGEGLSRERYAQYNQGQLRTPFGRRRLARVALVDGTRWLATAKRYDLALLLDGARLPAVGIGAVFTPPRLRGRGYAAEIIARISETAHAGGAAVAVLFSEIGTAYYERLGFETLPLADATLAVHQRPGAPAILLRTGEERDLPFVAAMHNERAATWRLALEYDADWIGYSLAKKRMLAALGEPGRAAVEFFVVEEGGRPAAWLIVHVLRRGSRPSETWTIYGCGDRDPSGARVGAMIQALLARDPSASPPVIHGWWPRRFAPPQVAPVSRRASATIMMARRLGGGGPVLHRPAQEDDVLYWLGDAF